MRAFSRLMSMNLYFSRVKSPQTDAVDNWWAECNIEEIFLYKDRKKNQKTDIQSCLVRLSCDLATLYIRLKRFEATVRATIGLHSRSKNLCTSFIWLLITLGKENCRRPHGMLYVVHKGPPLDSLWVSDQRFLGKPRVTLGDSIELYAIVASPCPLQSEEVVLLLKIVDWRVSSRETSELDSDCALPHTRVMVRISRRVVVNNNLLVGMWRNLTPNFLLSAASARFFQGQILIQVRTPGPDGRHFDGCSSAFLKTVHLVDCDFLRIQDSKNRHQCNGRDTWEHRLNSATHVNLAHPGKDRPSRSCIQDQWTNPKWTWKKEPPYCEICVDNIRCSNLTRNLTRSSWGG